MHTTIASNRGWLIEPGSAMPHAALHQGLHRHPARAHMHTAKRDCGPRSAPARSKPANSASLAGTGWASGLVHCGSGPIRQVPQGGDMNTAAPIAPLPCEPGNYDPPDGTPAWFIPNPEQPGKLLRTGS